MHLMVFSLFMKDKGCGVFGYLPPPSRCLYNKGMLCLINDDSCGVVPTGISTVDNRDCFPDQFIFDEWYRVHVSSFFSFFLVFMDDILIVSFLRDINNKAHVFKRLFYL